ILKQQGTVDKYMGDAIMAFWNAPLPQADHQARACLAMLDMRQALNGFNALQERDGKPPIAIAMGCATGEACVGNLGSTERFNYSAIGDTVNTAARVETSCRSVGYDIVVMRDTATGASDIATLSAGAIAAKGKSTRLPIEIVVGGPEVAKSPAFAALKTHHQTLMKALASGATRNKAEQLISLCVTACHSVDPALAQFYSRVLDRREDFRN
ncbi:MAG: adenylate/guanylate cyclase domain-containing protein, partial [Pseudomonadota bacterium]